MEFPSRLDQWTDGILWLILVLAEAHIRGLKDRS